MQDRDSVERRTLLFSSEAGSDVRLKMGSAHYSYGIVARRFSRMLERQGDHIVFLNMPEKYKRRQDLAYEVAHLPERPFHLCFRSTENLRPLPLGYNICHFAWEFDELSERTLVSEPISKNQRHMLSLMDEIWVPSVYTKDVLAAHGIANVHVVPTPVCAAVLPQRQRRDAALEAIGLLAAVPFFMASGVADDDNAMLARRMMTALADQPVLRKARENDGKIFLTVCNPGDRRKNLLNAVDGFLMGARDKDVLIVKLAAPATKTAFEDSPFKHLRPRFNGSAAAYHPRVLLLSDYLHENEMGALYSLADYYLSPSHCEGHNLPLLEAMAHGCLPIATRNTAMTDYIDSQNAVVIAERRYLGAVTELASEVSGVSPTIAFADRFDIARAIRAALALTAQQHDAMTERGSAIVLERYAEPVILRLVNARLDAAGMGGQSRAS